MSSDAIQIDEIQITPNSTDASGSITITVALTEQGGGFRLPFKYPFNLGQETGFKLPFKFPFHVGGKYE